MGEMKYIELIMIFDGEFWQYVMDISKTIHLNINTEEKILNFISSEYSNINYDLEFKQKEIYIITDEKIPCKNCN
jgi:hypothetical protein